MVTYRFQCGDDRVDVQAWQPQTYIDVGASGEWPVHIRTYMAKGRAYYSLNLGQHGGGPGEEF